MAVGAPAHSNYLKHAAPDPSHGRVELELHANLASEVKQSFEELVLGVNVTQRLAAYLGLGLRVAHLHELRGLEFAPRHPPKEMVTRSLFVHLSFLNSHLYT